jgi:hypothetical protein
MKICKDFRHKYITIFCSYEICCIFVPVHDVAHKPLRGTNQVISIIQMFNLLTTRQRHQEAID